MDRIKHDTDGGCYLTDYRKAAEEFIKETTKFHEQNRWNFQLHPNFYQRIQELAGDKKIAKMEIKEEKRV